MIYHTNIDTLLWGGVLFSHGVKKVAFQSKNNKRYQAALLKKTIILLFTRCILLILRSSFYRIWILILHLAY